MLLFCPTCANLLTVSQVQIPDPYNPTSGATVAQNRLECRTCPYQYLLKKRFYERQYFTRQEREDVFGGPEAFANAQKAAVQCNKLECDGMEAAFYQVQIRSADEPMTTFYKCLTCQQRWREN